VVLEVVVEDLVVVGVEVGDLVVEEEEEDTGVEVCVELEDPEPVLPG